MQTEKTSSAITKKLQSKLSKLGLKEPFMAGTLVTVHRRCGRPNCKCATGGPTHTAHILTTKVKAKTKAIYVPVDMVETVGRWCAQYRLFKAQIKEVSACCEQLVRLHSKEKRAAKRKACSNR
jgi:hypothetical protein